MCVFCGIEFPVGLSWGVGQTDGEKSVICDEYDVL